jgi:Domain of unknown function (DUF4602)
MLAHPPPKRNETTMAPTTKKPRPAVQIVQCQSAFPVSKNKYKKAMLQPPPRPQEDQQQQQQRTKDGKSTARGKPPPEELDFAMVSREIRHLGATAFVKQQKKSFEDEQYERLTGRKRKGLKVPIPILRGRYKKQVAREAAAAQHAKESGIVLESSSSLSPNKRQRQQQKSNSNNKESRVYGPAPSVGFVAKGILRVNPKRVNDV